jgi:hypothetical protein
MNGRRVVAPPNRKSEKVTTVFPSTVDTNTVGNRANQR